MLIIFIEIILCSFIFSLIFYRARTKIPEKRYKTHFIVKNYFSHGKLKNKILDKFTTKNTELDLEFIGLDIDKKLYAMYKFYISFFTSIIYGVIYFIFNLYKLNLLKLTIYTFLMFVIVLGIIEFLLKIAVKITKEKIRAEFLKFLGLFSRTLQLGSSMYVALNKSKSITNGTIRKYIDMLIDELNSNIPLHESLQRFGIRCRDKFIIDFTQQMSDDIYRGADPTQYIIDTTDKIISDKAVEAYKMSDKLKFSIEFISGLVVGGNILICIVIYAIFSFSKL